MRASNAGNYCDDCAAYAVSSASKVHAALARESFECHSSCSTLAIISWTDFSIAAAPPIFWFSVSGARSFCRTCNLFRGFSKFPRLRRSAGFLMAGVRVRTNRRIFAPHLLYVRDYFSRSENDSRSIRLSRRANHEKFDPNDERQRNDREN